LPQETIADLNQNGMDEIRRGFMRNGFVTALGGAVGVTGSMSAFAAGEGDPAILEKQDWQTTLGKNVATMLYGTPSIYEANLIRRESPSLSRVSAASVAFTPLRFELLSI
jgi:sulfane dehydrogenase subunit SoxC